MIERRHIMVGGNLYGVGKRIYGGLEIAITH